MKHSKNQMRERTKDEIQDLRRKIRSRYPPKKSEEEIEKQRKESEQKWKDRVQAIWDSMVELPEPSNYRNRQSNSENTE